MTRKASAAEAKLRERTSDIGSQAGISTHSLHTVERICLPPAACLARCAALPAGSLSQKWVQAASPLAAEACKRIWGEYTGAAVQSQVQHRVQRKALLAEFAGVKWQRCQTTEPKSSFPDTENTVHKKIVAAGDDSPVLLKQRWAVPPRWAMSGCASAAWCKIRARRFVTR